MPGGTRDSSKTRVAPFFDELRRHDAFGQSWIPGLLSLPSYGSDKPRPTTVTGLKETGWGNTEVALRPPVSLLSWLLRNLRQPSSVPHTKVQQERKELINGDVSRIKQGLDRLRSGHSSKAWYVLEGDSRPDAFLATNDVVIVIEGKRTEAGPTTSTTWLDGRHQMLRHLDAAFEIAGRRSLYGFFIVEGDDHGKVPPVWVEASRQTLSPISVDQSLPHRPAVERQVITAAFLGVTTWQQACSALGVPFSDLPDKVNSPRS